jgi:hypothetical protein
VSNGADHASQWPGAEVHPDLFDDDSRSQGFSQLVRQLARRADCDGKYGRVWHPVYNVLEEGHTLLLVNPQHIKMKQVKESNFREVKRFAPDCNAIRMESCPGSRWSIPTGRWKARATNSNSSAELAFPSCGNECCMRCRQSG